MSRPVLTVAFLTTALLSPDVALSQSTREFLTARESDRIYRSLESYNDRNQRTSMISSLDLATAFEASNALRNELIENGIVPASLVEPTAFSQISGLMGAAIETVFPELSRAFSIEPRLDYQLFLQKFANGREFDFNRRQDAGRFGSPDDVDALGNVAYVFAMRDSLGFKGEFLGVRSSTWIAGGVELLDDQRENLFKELSETAILLNARFELGYDDGVPFGRGVFWVATSMDFEVDFPDSTPGMNYYRELISSPSTVLSRGLENDLRDFLFLEEAASFHEYHRGMEFLYDIFGDDFSFDVDDSRASSLTTPYKVAVDNWYFLDQGLDTPYESPLGIDYDLGVDAFDPGVPYRRDFDQEQ